MDEKLELRMYCMSIYNVSAIQAAIQAQHAITRYSRKYQESKIYKQWADIDQTTIVLSAGTTNLNPDKLGTINIHYKTLIENGIDCIAFYEPDLGDQMTSIAFIVDERVFNFKKYPNPEWFNWSEIKLKEKGYTLSWQNDKLNDWIENIIGGKKNYFLREYLKNIPLWK